MELMDVIRRRRSIRAFRNDPIPDDVLGEILEAGRVGPTAMNVQDCRFGIITDADVKAKLVEVSGGQEWITTAPVIIALCRVLAADIKTLPDDDINVLVWQARYGRAAIDHLNALEDRRVARMLLDWRDTAYVGQQMVLAAENFGIASCWIGLIDTPKADAVLGLPEDVVCDMLLPLGYPAEEPEAIERKTIEEITFRNRWGES
ncbi:MAG: nitroreductase family protein [Planctomycetota bacterium]|nr:nitroreductase family protein [Planctomycetota bacterium]